MNGDRRNRFQASDSHLTRREIIKSTAAGLAALGLIASSKRALARADPSGLLDVVVIGAGLAGLTAARDLRRAGLDSFIVLEARDRVGGRTVNLPIGDGYVVEGGGQWVGPGQTAVLDLAWELGVETFRTYDKGNLVVLSGGKTTLVTPTASIVGSAPFQKELDALALTVPLDAPWTAAKASEWDKMTFGAWLDQNRVSGDERQLVDLASTLTFGVSPDKLSLLWVLFYIHSAGGYAKLESMEGGAQQDRIVGGSQILSLRMAEDVKTELVMNAPVTEIRNWQRQSDAVEIVVGNKTYRAKAVVLTLPPALCERIRFQPALPPMRAALQAKWPTYGTAVKAYLIYPTPFWRAKGLSGQALTTDGAFYWTVDNSPPDGAKGALMGFIAATDSRTDREKSFTAAMVQCFGPEAGQPTHYLEQNWATETFTRGCVGPLPPGLLSTCGPALRQDFGRVIVAGTDTELIWNGYMDGAVRSGHRAALVALRALS